MKKIKDLRVTVSINEAEIGYLLEDIEILKAKLDEVEIRLTSIIKNMKVEFEQLV